MEERAVYRLLSLSVSLSLSLFDCTYIYQSVCLSVCLCVSVCAQVEWKRHSPKITFPSLDYSTLHFVKPRKEVKHCTQVPQETRDKNAINLPILYNYTSPIPIPIPMHPPSPAKLSLWVAPNNKLKRLQQSCRTSWNEKFLFWMKFTISLPLSSSLIQLDLSFTQINQIFRLQ